MRTDRPRILLLGDTLHLGGTEGQFVEVATRLDRSRWDVHVACLRAEGPLRARLEAAGVGVRSCGPESLKSPRFAMAMWGLVRYLRAHRIRLVHSFGFYSNILGVPAAHLAGVPAVIASQRDLGDLQPPLQRRVHRIVLRMASHVLVNSQAVAERLKRSRSPRPGRIVVIPNGIDLGRFAPQPGPRPHRDGARAGTVTNLRPEKGIGDLVKAAALVRERYRDARFLIWGEGPLRTHLEGLVRTLRLDRVVEFRGATAAPEVALRELDIFVLPSLSEACSNALLEAMAAELPVVATHVGGNPLLVEDEISGLLVPPSDPAALAKAIIRLMEEPALAAELAARGRHRVLGQFTFERMLTRVEALYDQALAERGG